MSSAAQQDLDAVYAALEEKLHGGTAAERETARGILRKVAPERLLPAEPPVGAVLECDAGGGRELIVRGRNGYRRIELVATNMPNPLLSWGYVHKLPGLVRLVPEQPAQGGGLVVEFTAPSRLAINGHELSYDAVASLSEQCEQVLRAGTGAAR
ncbi:hypothetical protein [Actinoplanes sp. URMC 104]|uniref:hypothetical protein n=1 Tax=Actinoplanes sp. URMC 104 TaxID=3423409 RepID=UPI003F19958D